MRGKDTVLLMALVALVLAIGFLASGQGNKSISTPPPTKTTMKIGSSH